MAHDVFVSYSQQDKAVADALCAALETNRIRCWIAPRDVPAGRPFPGALIRAIGESRVFVLVFSDGANRSQHVLNELAEAVDREIPIIPFRIEDVQPSGDLGYYLKTIHWLDALTPPMEAHLEVLTTRVQALLGTEGREIKTLASAASPAQHPKPPGAGPLGPKKKLGKLAGPVGAALLLLVGVAVGSLGGRWLVSRRAPGDPLLPAPSPMATDSSRTTAVGEGAGQGEPSTPQAATEPAPAALAPSLTPRVSQRITPPVATVTPSPTTAAWTAWSKQDSLPAPGASPQQLFRSGDRLWVQVQGGVFVLSLEGEILDEAHAGECMGLWAWDGQSLWVVSGRQVRLCDPASWQAQTLFEIELDNAEAAAWDGSSLWVIDVYGTLARYDPSGKRVQQLAVPVSGWPVAMAWVEGELWVAAVHGAVSRFAAGGFEPVGSFGLGECGVGWAPSQAAIYWDGESLWVADTDASRILRCVPGGP